MIGIVGAMGKLLYWTAVILISLALVVALILYFESLDASQVGG